MHFYSHCRHRYPSLKNTMCIVRYPACSDHSKNKMSLHWTIIAGFLYAEIGFMLVLLLPFISTRMWHKVSRQSSTADCKIVNFLFSTFIPYSVSPCSEWLKDQQGSSRSIIDTYRYRYIRIYVCFKDIGRRKSFRYRNPVLRIQDVYPGSWPLSIPVPGSNNNNKGGGREILLPYLFCSQKYHKI